MATILSLTFLPLQSFARTADEPSSLTAPKPTDPAESAEARTLMLRLNEIKSMDKATLKPTEKRALRKEVKSINHSLRESSGGIYLSVGAIILIVVLLIVLL